MASTTPATVPASTVQSGLPAENRLPSAARGRGTSRAGRPNNSRGRGRGRGVRGDYIPGPQRPLQQHQRPAPPRPPPDDAGGGGVSSRSLARDAASEGAEDLVVDKGKSQDGDVDADVCFICASPVIHNSVAPCNHRTCHICALRLRALYKTRACAHCRTEAQYLIFTDDATKRYEDFVEPDIKHTDETLAIKYTDNDIHADTVLLLRYNCPDRSCDVACLGWPHLHHHVKTVHHKIMCDLCTRNKKVFTHEHDLFTPQELRKHEKVGDDHPGAVDQSGFRGHPECGFCRQRFYGDDELYTHCREKHERCHICDRRRQGAHQQYYLNYDSLEQHFKKDHFLCADQECLDKKFVVFESEMDMKAHQLEMHPNGLTKDARRDARRVDISTFDYRTPHQEPRRGRGGREGRERGRGRDPNTEPLPQSTAQPLRRDELAFQRQLAIGSTQAGTARTFGGQITSDDPPPARSTHTASSSANPPTSALENLNLTSHASSEPPTPQQQARQIAHTALLTRASTLLGNNPTKLATFRSSVSSYQHNTLSAGDLITAFFSLFDAPSSDLGKLIHELADLYESAQKRELLLKAWHDWRAINEDYPSLPNAGPSLPGATSASLGHRVLKLKSSTAPSARGAQVSKTSRGWGAAAAATSTSAKSPAISSTGSIAKVGTTTPWVSSSASPAPSRPSSVKPTPASATDAFPALPAARKPNTLIAGLTRGSVKPAWDAGGAVGGSAWAGSALNGDAATSINGVIVDEERGEPVATGKKKGKQGKKEVLYKFG